MAFYAPASGASLYPLFNFTRFVPVAMPDRTVRPLASSGEVELAREERDGGRATALAERGLLFFGGTEGRAFGDAFPFAVALHEGVDPNIGAAE